MGSVHEFLDRLVLQMTATEWWTNRDLVEGIFVVGALGSGKTSGSGFKFASAMLKAGYGGLVCVAKPDELRTWAGYFAASGRDIREDLVVIQPDPPHPQLFWPHDLLGPAPKLRHNILRHEFIHGGGLTSNVIDVLYTSMFETELAKQQDPFWREACREMTTHAVDLAVLASPEVGEEEVRLDDILDIIMTAPTSVADLDSRRFQSGRCAELIRLADERRGQLPEPRFRDLQQTVRYWMVHFPALAVETRSSIVATFTAKLSLLLRSPLRELLTGDSDSAAAPERSLEPDPVTGRPKVIVLNLPVKLYGDVGRLAQVMYKVAWQRAADRRVRVIEEGRGGWSPAFLWADEAQYFLTAQDALFQQTARSALVSSVYLTQNLPNLYAELGETRTHSLLGNLQTKIFHANGDPTTNELAQRVFGNAMVPMYSTPVSGGGQKTHSTAMLPLVPAIKFAELSKGGGRGRRVGAYVFQAGRQWELAPELRHYVEFEQPSVEGA